MWRIYGDQGLSVMAFPCNQFGGQEPGTDEEIKEHVQEKYGVTFDMMSKINVNGPDQIPLYEWMKSTEPGKNQPIKWNFTNFVIDRCGRVRQRHEPPEHPETWEDQVVALLLEEPAC
ncbi:Oidioi.mRNA.OKI2018_I69.chr1.g1185.t1.cds [Oikopleura dioica]|uniref:Glutathione peroxidase n=1 Tax=Oikopleura dioica TaxID=34765 RepID=A0ABN7SM61_OIKDI|nr:Oidioi.mRNA.OKI2018_I69.chr1.g1185.t1.cds [Oikopleura dioica]